MFEQCLEFKPRYAVLSDEVAAGELRIQLKLHGSATEVLSGSAAICEVVQLDEVDQVMAAITGVAGCCRLSRLSVRTSVFCWRTKKR